AHAPLHRYLCEEAGGELSAFPGVFSSERLDAGSRLLLEQFERLEPVERMIDLACGNGVLGLVACRRELAQSVTFADESALALASTRHNAVALLPGSVGSFDFLHGDGLSGYRGPPVSLILCNPPFHHEASVEESAGRHLLMQCKRHLRPGGQLCVVANRHLRYRPLLARQFERVEKLAENRKFIVWRCLK
ncbi:MAG: methyltransferase, partial [Halioglobus sp.]|nr:methyltransferase [Halioglobus sp.]